MDTVEQLQINLTRLKRAVDLAASLDAAAIWDMTHILRVFVDLLPAITQLDNFRAAKAFRTCSPAQKFMKKIKRFPHVVTYFGEGIRVKLDDMSHDTVGHPNDPSNKALISFKCKFEEPLPTLVLQSYIVVFGNVEDETRLFAGRSGSAKVNFYSWMKGEVARVSYRNDQSKIFHTILTREQMIKRVANKYGASHPIGGEDGGIENSLDPYIDYLMKFTCYGYPVPYFILMKTAIDILEAFPVLLGKAVEDVGK